MSRILFVLAPSWHHTMSLPPANFDQFSSLSLAKAASKKHSQAKWYQKYVLDTQPLTPTNPPLGTRSTSNGKLMLMQRECSLSSLSLHSIDSVFCRYKREKIQSKVESNVTTQLTHTLSQHGGGSTKRGKKCVVQWSMSVSTESQTSDYTNVSWSIVWCMLSDVKITMMTFQSYPTTQMMPFLSPRWYA